MAFAFAAGKNRSKKIQLTKQKSIRRWIGRYRVLEIEPKDLTARPTSGNMVISRMKKTGSKLTIDLTRPDTKHNKGIMIGPKARHRTIKGIEWEKGGRIYLQRPALLVNARAFSQKGDVIAGVIQDGTRIIAWIALAAKNCRPKDPIRKRQKK